MLRIPVLGRLRQEDLEFKANLSHTARPCLKNKRTKDLQEWPHLLSTAPLLEAGVNC
jgi:hypothetical protein